MEPAGVEVQIVWRGRRARAFVPTRLADRDLELDGRTVARAARAQAAVEHGAETMPEEYAALARLLLRAEGVASSFIEGVTAPVVDVVLAELDDHGAPSSAAWVAANLAAVTEAIDEAHAGPLSVDSLCRWHRTLMTGSPTPAQHVGVLRTEQGWVGGASPLDAHLVTPPPDEVPALVDDPVAYVNRCDVDPRGSVWATTTRGCDGSRRRCRAPVAPNRSWSRRSRGCSASGASDSASLGRSRGACGAMPRPGACSTSSLADWCSRVRSWRANSPSR